MSQSNVNENHTAIFIFYCHVACMRVYKDIQVAELSALNCKQVGNRCNEIDSRDARDLTGRVIREQTHG